MALIGETRGRPGGERVEIEIGTGVRTQLRALLNHPAMRGVGYSEFILRAVDQARREIKAQEDDAA